MAQLIHKGKILLPKMKYITSLFGLFKGLMFANPNKIKKGICLTMPGKKYQNSKASIHMLFCFYPYEILFVNSNFKVVDKKILNSWSLGYTPKKPTKYVIESWKNTFSKIKINDTVKIKNY